MASKRPKKQAELPGQPNSRAPIDAAALLAASTPILARLEEDLLARMKASPAVTAAMTQRYEKEKGAKRTAETFAGWSSALATQVAAAWLLSCVFVRTLEDRGLLKQARIAGPGAEDSQREFFQLAPSLTERDYLLTVFRELAQHPAAKDLFDAEHSLVWKLSPSAEAAKELLALFRTPSAKEPAFRFGQASTRFLGDLYQDISDDVRKRYALLQTPDFVEEFILDRTLEPAIARFGLDDTTLIDPTCGSGHFLLGAFDRLFEHRLRAEPGIDPRAAAVKALDGVYGADINPYAVAIARFRLTLSFLEKAGYTKLAEAPALPLHLVVADSLRINPQHPQQELWQQQGASAQDWLGDVFTLEDEKAARDVLFRQYAAVVGNPPYITVKDAAMREVYRDMYTAAAGKYALSAPFCERFFQLARPRGYTVQITANSFMKREFGKRLIEQVLPSLNLELIVNTSGAYVPGHGTPTVLLFGTHEERQGSDVLAVLAKRGEPSTPEDPSQGLVWRSIADHFAEVGYENDFISTARLERSSLEQHPWSLGGGGASELKELLEERATTLLGEVAESIGISSFTLEDDVFLRPIGVWQRLRVPAVRLRPMVTGEMIRDWALEDDLTAFFPYDEKFDVVPANTSELRVLWAYRTVLANNKLFGGKTKVQGGLAWFEFGRLTADKLRTPLTITFAFVATHNHFVLDRSGRVFNRTAPIIKLPDGATEDDHFALLAFLNSSTACFWMKQVFHRKTSASQKHHADPARAAYEFAGTGLHDFPVPDLSNPTLILVARELSALGEQRAAWLGGALSEAPASTFRSREEVLKLLAEGWANYDEATHRAAYLQEELDWVVYEQFGLATTSIVLDSSSAQILGARPFEVVAGYDAGVSERARNANEPTRSPVAQPAHWRARSIDSPELGLIETREFKRMWRDTEQNIDQLEFRRGVERKWLDALIATRLENAVGSRSETANTRVFAIEIKEHLSGIADLLSQTTNELARRIADHEAVPFAAALTYNEAGLATVREWQATWGQQRLEDEGKHAAPSIPSKFAQGDFLEGRYWSLRGKLDVPTERFISYPFCESDTDGESVYGWAGWDHLQRAQALGALYLNRRDAEGWTADRLTPMLAGLLELIPWVKQWHNEPSAEFGGLRMGDYYAQFLDEECRRHNLTHDDLRAWRPPKKTRAAKKPAKAKGAKATNGDAADPAPAEPKPMRTRRKKAAAAEPTAAEETD